MWVQGPGVETCRVWQHGGLAIMCYRPPGEEWVASVICNNRPHPGDSGKLTWIGHQRPGLCFPPLPSWNTPWYVTASQRPS